MNILLFHPEKEALKMIGFCLESQLGLNVTPATAFQEAIGHLLEEGSIDLIITCVHSETEKVFKYLLSTGSNIPVILVTSNEHQLPSFPDVRILGELDHSVVPDKLLELIRTHFQEIINGEIHHDYCRINPELLVRVVPLRGDIYIRLSSIKFVKLFRAGAVFTQEDLEKFLVKRKVNYLYMQKAASQEFVLKFKDDLANLVQNAEPGDTALLDTVSEVHELIQDLSNRMGFTPEVQEIARENIQLTIKAIGHSPRLSKALASSNMKSRNYVSSHSVLLASIACSIAAQMEWPSNTTFHKLTLAAFFHDFHFNEFELAKISRKHELEGMKSSLTPEQYDLVKNHPIKAAEMIRNLTEVPGDVEFLIMQHHERPDGSGFPKGLRATQIAPLAAVFIVAHDMIDHITKLGSQFDLKNFLHVMEKEYQSGSFKKIWQVLSQGLATGDEDEDTTAA